MTHESDGNLVSPSAPSPARPQSRSSATLLLGEEPLWTPASSASAETTPGEQAPQGSRLRLFALSFLMLFVELALIRWAGANIIYLSYFSNFVLLGSFLGIGIGFLRAKSRLDLFPLAPIALALLIVYILAFPVKINRSGDELLFFTSLKTTGLPIWVTLPIIFLVVAAVMAMISEGVARTFIKFRPLDAYRLDILGSLTGIAAFSLLSFIDAKPFVWGLVVAVIFALLYGKRIGVLQIVGLLLVVGMLGGETFSSADIWSPYYRLTVYKIKSGAYVIDANGVPHQTIQAANRQLPFYSVPYQQAPSNTLNNVLVIGAGTGNDVATALREGAKHVDAVEIDPAIQKLGVQLNPDHPYSSPRVSVYINDGRAFLEQTKKKYDMILFALPDSLTLVSGQSSLRLESYLFTLQAVQAAKADLNPSDGTFAMYNYYRTGWLKNRLANTVDLAFGHAPCVTTAAGTLSMLTVSDNPSELNCTQIWQRPANVLAPATDDHPFVYLDGNSIPSYYLLTLGLILLASIVAVRATSGPVRRAKGYVDLFFMGAAFMLLETKSIVQFALLFGTTWFVNALVTAGVLVAVFAAVEVSRRVVIRRPMLLYGALLVSLVVAWIVPLDDLLSWPTIPRFLVAVLLSFTPIFIANVVFAQRFRDTGDTTVAFGVNLLGAMVGGVLEYTSMIFGYRWLLILVAVLYGFAFLLGRAHWRSSPGTAVKALPS
jgi:Spermine/spermidine synthase domain